MDMVAQVQDIVTVFAQLARLVGRVVNGVLQAAEKAEEKHRRAQRLAAYRRRRQWKRSDMSSLLSLGVNKAAVSRMRRLPVRRGRPIVRPYTPISEVILAKLLALGTVCNSKSTPDQRRRAFKDTPWWKHHVEAFYRGEHRRAVEDKIAGPSDFAERKVGAALGISQGKVHAICGAIRELRRSDELSANFPEATLEEYEEWMTTGKPSWRDCQQGHSPAAMPATRRADGWHP